MDLKVFTWSLIGMVLPILIVSSDNRWYPTSLNQNFHTTFEQKASRFWEFREETRTWVEISMPFDLVSCINGSCSKVASIERTKVQPDQISVSDMHEGKVEVQENHNMFLPIRKRVTVTKTSEASIWVTGQSGMIYERFWNGVQWVLAPRDLPISAGPAISIFIVNQTMLALSENQTLHELQLGENGQPIWVELKINMETKMSSADKDSSLKEAINSGIVCYSGEKLYVSTVSGSLLELSELHPLSWKNHTRPPGADVRSVVDASAIRPGVVFTLRYFFKLPGVYATRSIFPRNVLSEASEAEVLKVFLSHKTSQNYHGCHCSSSGELYEFDKNSKPLWKKHIWNTSAKEIISTTSRGCVCQYFGQTKAKSLFLLTEAGSLVERRLHQRKWKWIVHGHPDGFRLSAITLMVQNDANGKTVALFCTTSTGLIFEYQLSQNQDDSETQQKAERWVNHMHPPQAKVARGIQGIQLQFGRMIFPLDDGRLGELHLPNTGGEGSGPVLVSVRRKASYNYEWSVLEAPETEGWNGEYCTDSAGPANCLAGTRDPLIENELDDHPITASTRRWKNQERNKPYLSLVTQRDGLSKSTDQRNYLKSSINSLFRMRTMHTERSFFFITEKGLVFEYVYTEDNWLWLRHEHDMAIKGALGNFNGSLYLVDTNGNLLIRERRDNELSWINCTSIRKGRQVATAAPWDGVPGEDWKVASQNELFFINRKGKLLQLTVFMRKFTWKDCQSPPNSRIAFILDQEVLRMNIIFVVGRDGRLYQYNKITELWHKHFQSPHLVLSRVPGSVMRPSPLSLTGSLFMILENGGLVEYHWNAKEGWNWVEHGTPNRETRLEGAPGPCLGDGNLFLIGSDGHVYRRYMNEGMWKWASHGYPHSENTIHRNIKSEEARGQNENTNKYCDEKVAPVRPIPFSEYSVIFELRDGRVAELRKLTEEEPEWEWWRIIGTPTSLCLTEDYWTAVAS